MNSIFSTAISGMNAAVARLSNAATNIVNASSTGKIPSSTGEKTTAFEPQDIVTLSNDRGDDHLGVRAETVPRDPSYVPVYSPSSPDANEQGLIAAPNVDLAREILDVMTAELAYKASAKVISAEKRNEETLIDTLS